MVQGVSFEVYPATTLRSAEQLRNVLESCVVFEGQVLSDEVNKDIVAVESFRTGADRERYFAVARTPRGVTLGMMGLQSPIPELLPHATTLNPGELINAYVLESTRGMGVGRALVSHLRDRAISEGFTQFVLNSGPRYEHTGWPFWRNMFGDEVGELPGFYDGWDAKVWRSKPLEVLALD